jgi:hypothetical protein
MSFDYFDELGDTIESTGTMEVHPEGTYVLELLSGGCRQYTGGSVCVETEFSVAAKEIPEKQRKNSGIWEKPNSGARIFARHFLFILVDKNDTSKGFKVNPVGGRIFYNMLKVLHGYADKGEVSRAYPSEVDPATNVDGNIDNALEICESFGSKIDMQAVGQNVKSVVSIQINGQYKSNEVKNYKDLSSFEKKSFDLFLSGGEENKDDTASEFADESTDDNIPF